MPKYAADDIEIRKNIGPNSKYSPEEYPYKIIAWYIPSNANTSPRMASAVTHTIGWFKSLKAAQKAYKEWTTPTQSELDRDARTQLPWAVVRIDRAIIAVHQDYDACMSLAAERLRHPYERKLLKGGLPHWGDQRLFSGELCVARMPEEVWEYGQLQDRPDWFLMGQHGVIRIKTPELEEIMSLDSRPRGESDEGANR